MTAIWIGIEMNRHNERDELLLKPERRPSGYRKYDESRVARLEYIQRVAELGYSLPESGKPDEWSGRAHCFGVEFVLHHSFPRLFRGPGGSMPI